MVRLRTPLLSMGAHGTIGRAVTFQSSNKLKFARRKPVLPYSLTLAQQYQRWLYEDYCAYWHEQTEAQRRGYAAAGSRVHLTAFQYFMKYHLKNLPDISLLCHLDSVSGALAVDSSRHENHGTVFGALSVPGVISRALYFDGVNDRVTFPFISAYDLRTAFSLMFFTRIDAWGSAAPVPVSRGQNFTVYYEQPAVQVIQGWFVSNGAWKSTGATPAGSVLIGDTHHVAITWDSITFSIYLDGYLSNSNNHAGFLPNSVSTPLFLASDPAPASWHKGILDHLILLSRCVTHADVLRHSKRRYPSQ